VKRKEIIMNNMNNVDINSMHEQLVKQNEELMKNNSQVLIEDGTMASFGFNNPSEVKVNPSDIRR